MKRLIIGCGSRRIDVQGNDLSDADTLDFNSDHNPKYVWDLENKPWPIPDDTYNEVHAYEVLEHLGRQGDFRSFFADFSEIWRILKPGGMLIGTSPAWPSPWIFGDPGHTRVISPECFVFLDQSEYVRQVGKTPLSDYRFCYKADFEAHQFQIMGETFIYMLRAVKPSRIDR
jgi:SAM-dependent methyltransferase